MIALGWISAAEHGCLASRLLRPRTRKSERRGRRVRLAVEGLEPIALLAATCPTISGFVFLDEDPTNPALTNNGLFNTGEAPIANSQVELFDASNRLVATTTSDPLGAYSFGGTSSSVTGVPLTITQTISLGSPASPNIPTNFMNQPLSPALQLFN